MSKSEWEQEVLRTIPYFNSSLIPQWSLYPDTGCGREGFTSESISMQRAMLLGLYRVMEGWNGGNYGSSGSEPDRAKATPVKQLTESRFTRAAQNRF
ncbi:hypothetical protein PM082_016209 [Marasmius tenuissimus]|nr:hypothetical protein PM082_016209 [Marasmius tenuissimus]